MSGRSLVDIWVDTEKRDKIIHLKCSETERLRLKALAESRGFKFVSDFIRWSVDTAIATKENRIATNNTEVDPAIATLKNGILEFNKLMSKAKPRIPEGIDKRIIAEGVKLAFQTKDQI